LDSLEKNITETASNRPENTSEEFTELKDQLKRVADETTKHTLTIAKHSEQLLRFEREFVETKDILKTFMLKYDNFVKETTEKMGDYEFAIEEIEKNLQVQLLVDTEATNEEENINFGAIELEEPIYEEEEEKVVKPKKTKTTSAKEKVEKNVSEKVEKKIKIKKVEKPVIETVAVKKEKKTRVSKKKGVL
jgi:hypothetical protein